ncbi:MAG TPA: hypothetical protein ENK06_13580, partial [Gammaproteobacteria bacterium]|nr:hypothetical protein [Gammaproteobacteria bacterium]
MVGFVTWEFLVPFFSLLLLIPVDPVAFTLLFVGFMSLYECGYLVNDSAASCNESGGNRLGGLSIRKIEFCIIRLSLFLLIVISAISILGLNEVFLFIGSVLFTTSLLLLHSSPLLYRRKLMRMFSFTGLASYKYAPYILPFAGVVEGSKILMALFLCYGFPRVLIYGFRKFGGGESRAITAHQMTLQGAAIMAFFPLLVAASSDQTISSNAFFQVWVVSFVAWIGMRTLRKVRRMMAGET